MQVFKSPQSNNKYARIAESGEVSLGLSVELLTQCVILRFCVFAKGKPKMKHFNFRSQVGMYANVKDMEDVLPGGQLDKITVQVRASKGGNPSLIGLRDGEMDRLIDWVKEQVATEGMTLIVTDQELGSIFQINDDKDCLFDLPKTLKVKEVFEDFEDEEEEA